MKSVFIQIILGKCNFTILCFFCASSTFAQSPQDVINNYLQSIGGKSRWVHLESRKSVEQTTLYNSSGFVETVDRSLDFTKYYQAPNNYLDLWFDNWFYTIRCAIPNCVWYYFDNDLGVMLMPSKYQIKVAQFPRIGILEILNFPMKDSLMEEGNLFRIDFEDVFWNRTMSVYFDKQTYLVVKHTYSNTGVDFNEYYYKDYREKDEYVEPYIIENYVDNKKYKVTVIKNIDYNSTINSKIFIPPIDSLDIKLSTDRKQPEHIELQDRIPFIY